MTLSDWSVFIMAISMSTAISSLAYILFYYKNLENKERVFKFFKVFALINTAVFFGALLLNLLAAGA